VTDVPKDAPSYAPQFGGELRQYAGIPKEKVLPEKLQRQLIHGYYAATSYVDAQIGRVLDALDESGLAENTIVVLWGDHGWHLGDHGMWCKHTNYEQAVRIPFLISKPGAKPGSGVKTKAFAETVDLYPTLCVMAGLPSPTGTDGLSLATTLSDSAASTRTHVMHVYPRGNKMGRAIRTARYRLVEWKVPGAASESADLELYDYEKDPLETKNIAAENPETVGELRAILKTYPEAKPQLHAKRKIPEKTPVDRTALFSRRDANKDDKLTLEEFLTNQDDLKKAKARFPNFDKDSDGFLTRDEFGK
jgi:iduronate 2-sulfatase